MPASPWSRCVTRTPRWRTWMWPSRPTTRARGPQMGRTQGGPRMGHKKLLRFAWKILDFFLAKMRMNIKQLPEHFCIPWHFGVKYSFFQKSCFFAIPSPRHDPIWTSNVGDPMEHLNVGRRLAPLVLIIWTKEPLDIWRSNWFLKWQSNMWRPWPFTWLKCLLKSGENIDAQNWHEAVFRDLEEHSSSSIPDIPDIPRLYG